MDQIRITFSNGQLFQFRKGITIHEAVKKAYAKDYLNIVAAKLNDQIIDLSTIIRKDSSIHLITSKEAEGLQVLWHSASHIMAQAVKTIYPDAHLGIGPSISNGFYYDFQVGSTLTISELPKIERKIKEIIKKDQQFVKKILSKKEAISIFKEQGEQFKLELIQEITDQEVTVYQNGQFIDLCRGPHVPSTGYVKHLKLLNVAGAYWHGDERNPVLQRIYGVAFQDRESLDKHIQTIEEAKKRDHRKLGKELDLFSFHPEGPGFPFWHPNGVVIHNEITTYMHMVLAKYGYKEVKTPIILNEELWHRSGHWDNYKENMYFTTIDEQTYAVKPMNCPGGLLIYSNQPHSYRNLPLKLSEMGMVHRYEKSGVLHGLFRVRQFTQDDAHIFCTQKQLESEIVQLIDLVDEVYRTFGYEKFQIELSTKPARSIGTDSMWKDAETALHNALDFKKLSFQVNPGEGAFYGPKIDYHIQDSLGRLWQCGTLQVDFSMPERFGLDYIGSDGNKHRPVLIHRAILGSVERFIGILIEHVGGAFPVWLAPVQCVILPISEKHQDYANKIYNALFKSGIRCQIDNRSEKIGYKIREAETKKIPYMCITGDKEVENSTISIRKRRKGDLGNITLPEFTKKIKYEIKRRINN